MASEINRTILKNKVHHLIHSRFGGDFRRAFDHYDTLHNKSDLIDRRSLEGLLEAAGVGSYDNCRSWVNYTFQVLDKKRDQRISSLEFVQILNMPAGKSRA